ncbi:hypothetical protein SCLCIDRAFT_10735 [Scleroderma citrinum Foug A]|uniref:Uncharacterized protein n=1 Tax=Scleroderma citrinum Foug A TaxID=1036808 RepID=A0A0C3DK01_9AGAM|nr:hypothetical protein SCLCIDRAFT_10735 [Scleroderma citrinum Foug A]
MSIRGIATAGLVNPVVTMQDMEGVEVVNAGLINGNSSPSSDAQLTQQGATPGPAQGAHGSPSPGTFYRSAAATPGLSDDNMRNRLSEEPCPDLPKEPTVLQVHMHNQLSEEPHPDLPKEPMVLQVQVQTPEAQAVMTPRPTHTWHLFFVPDVQLTQRGTMPRPAQGAQVPFDMPFKEKVSSTLLFSTFSQYCNTTIHTMGQEIKGHMISPMPVKKFNSWVLPCHLLQWQT